MKFEDLSPGEQLYFELSNIVEDDIPQLPRKKQEKAIQHVIERMVEAAQTGRFSADLQLRLLNDIDTNLKGFRGYTDPLRNAIKAGLSGKPLLGNESGN